MTTKTKPKKPVDPYMIQVKIKKPDQIELCELCGFDNVSDPDNKKAEKMLSAVTGLLTFQYSNLSRLPDRPLPAHIVAALEPIAKKANELAALLHPKNLPVAVLAELDVVEVSTGEACHLLTSIAAAAEIAKTKLAQQDSTGKHRHQQRLGMESAIELISRLFDAHATGEIVGHERDLFIKTCTKYLSNPANKRTH